MCDCDRNLQNLVTERMNIYKHNIYLIYYIYFILKCDEILNIFYTDFLLTKDNMMIDCMSWIHEEF